MNYLTKKDQMLLVHMLNNGNSVEKSTQKVFVSLKFYEATAKLMRLGLITSRKKPNSNCNIYKLTDTGIYFAVKLAGLSDPKVYAIIGVLKE